MDVVELLDECWSGSLSTRGTADSPSSAAISVLSYSLSLSSTTGGLASEGTYGDLPTVQLQAGKMPQLQAVCRSSQSLPQAPSQTLTKPVPLQFVQTALDIEVDTTPSETTAPIPIPGANQHSLPCQPSLIRAVRIPEPLVTRATPHIAAGAPAATALTGSWTQRQHHFPLNRSKAWPASAHMAAKATASQAARARAAPPLILAPNAVKESAAREAAWRYQFKRKWIREELFARRREFPDEPGYGDSWAAALELVETCGSNAALQAALLEAPFKSMFKLDDDVMDGVESMLFEDLDNANVHVEKQEATPVSACRGIAAKAAVLVCLHRGKNAA